MQGFQKKNPRDATFSATKKKIKKRIRLYAKLRPIGHSRFAWSPQYWAQVPGSKPMNSGNWEWGENYNFPLLHCKRSWSLAKVRGQSFNGKHRENFLASVCTETVNGKNSASPQSPNLNPLPKFWLYSKKKHWTWANDASGRMTATSTCQDLIAYFSTKKEIDGH